MILTTIIKIKDTNTNQLNLFFSLIQQISPSFGQSLAIPLNNTLTYRAVICQN